MTINSSTVPVEAEDPAVVVSKTVAVPVPAGGHEDGQHQHGKQSGNFLHYF